MTIKTNNVPRFLISGYELTAKQRAEFDYMTSDEIDEQSFFIYQGVVYAMSEILRNEEGGELRELGWDGHYSLNAFCYVLVRLCDDSERVIIGKGFA